ncbi:MAG TPA: hypothetical protein VH853_07465 [Polyangia bacterium]|nr:hypothetical protein [Polyangia bacterium]
MRAPRFLLGVALALSGGQGCFEGRHVPERSSTPAAAAAQPAAPGVGAEGPFTSRTRYGCRDARDCRMPGAVCQQEPIIGKCGCRTDADCTPDETCYVFCELRCSSASDGCPRGGSCGSSYDFCVDPDRESDESFDLGEWRAKERAGVPGHEPRFLHATYDEWNGTGGHLRVSFRGDGNYLIELDGHSGWNRSFGRDGRLTSKGRELLTTGVLKGRGGTPSIHSLRAASCPEYRTGFRAELVLVAEFARLETYRGIFTHPKCKGFPSRYVDDIWRFVEKQTGGAVTRFDRATWGELPPTGVPTDAPDPHRLPCWPGQHYTGSTCTGLPASCPAGYVAAADGCQACPPGRTAVDGARHCCFLGQSWDGVCRGVPTCPRGFVRAGAAGCAREPEPPPEEPAYLLGSPDLADPIDLDDTPTP